MLLHGKKEANAQTQVSIRELPRNLDRRHVREDTPSWDDHAPGRWSNFGTVTQMLCKRPQEQTICSNNSWAKTRPLGYSEWDDSSKPIWTFLHFSLLSSHLLHSVCITLTTIASHTVTQSLSSPSKLLSVLAISKTYRWSLKLPGIAKNKPCL